MIPVGKDQGMLVVDQPGRLELFKTRINFNSLSRSCRQMIFELRALQLTVIDLENP